MGFLKILDKKFVGNTWKAIISKTAIDQLIFPLPILGSFYIFLSALEGKTNSIDEVMEECNVKLWVCNFELLPRHSLEKKLPYFWSSKIHFVPDTLKLYLFPKNV